MEHAWIEWDAAAILLLSSLIRGVKHASNFYSRVWEHWKFAYDLIITAGPSCCPFSAAGKQLLEADSRSCQVLDTTKAAVKLSALTLIMENVPDLVDLDHQHRLLWETIEYLDAHGYRLSVVHRLRDADLSGLSSRKRVFLVWEKLDMASCLPKCKSLIGSGSPDVLESVLCPVGSVKHLAAKGNYEEAPDEQVAGVPWRIGWYWLRGEPSRWTLGEAVKLPDSSKLWRLIEFKGRSVRLL
jgi:site-specific DNA-cytosine methylase